jgi:hypothetical protein
MSMWRELQPDDPDGDRVGHRQRDADRDHDRDPG